MAATTNSSNFKFKHICGYVKFNTEFDCSRVVLNFNTPVAGTFNVTFDESGNPQVSNLTETSNSITVVGDIQAGADYYVAVLPTTGGNGGFSMTLDPKPTKDMVDTKTKTINVKSRSRSASSSLATNRAKIKNLGTLTTSNTNENPAFTIPYEDMGIGDDIATAASGHTVLWAKINLGVDPKKGTEGETDPGEYYAWGETKPKDTYTKENYLCKDYYPLSLDAAHDAATVNWGHSWRMPTHADFVKMKENCIFVYGSNNGKTGFYVYRGNGEIKDYQKMSDFVYHYETGFGPASKQINDEKVINYINALTPVNNDYLFIVFAGHRNDENHSSDTGAARYWMNDHGEHDIYASEDKSELTAYYWGLANHTFNSLSQWQPRYAGLTIRPVFEITW